MRLTGNARWTPQVNMLEVECVCGARFETRADRWRVRCPQCPDLSNLQTLRDALVQYMRGGAETEAATALVGRPWNKP